MNPGRISPSRFEVVPVQLQTRPGDSESAAQAAFFWVSVPTVILLRRLTF